MHELAERKELVRLHSGAQGIAPRECAGVLDRITDLDDGPTGWSTRWRREGDRLAVAGRHLDAAARFNLARFPFADTEDGRLAHQRCVESFGHWAGANGVRRETLPVLGAEVPVWLAESTRNRGKVLVVCGGIVSIKEQWSKFVGVGKRLGLTVVLTELPGVGENPLVYGPDSGKHLTALLDALGGTVAVDSVYLAAMSFGGTVALRCAAQDPRVAGVFSVGPPIRHLFTDPDWWARVPMTTKDTLAVCTGIPDGELFARLGEFALTDDELAAVDAQVTTIVSLRDEIVPPADFRLAARLRRYRGTAFDDVHGSPAHLTDTALVAMGALADFAGAPAPLRLIATVALMVRGHRADFARVGKEHS